MIRKKYALEDHEENGLYKTLKLSRFSLWTCVVIFICCVAQGRKGSCNDTPPPHLPHKNGDYWFVLLAV